MLVAPLLSETVGWTWHPLGEAGARAGTGRPTTVTRRSHWDKQWGLKGSLPRAPWPREIIQMSHGPFQRLRLARAPGLLACAPGAVRPVRPASPWRRASPMQMGRGGRQGAAEGSRGQRVGLPQAWSALRGRRAGVWRRPRAGGGRRSVYAEAGLGPRPGSQGRRQAAGTELLNLPVLQAWHISSLLFLFKPT